VRYLVASLLLTSACATDTEHWWPTTSAGGKADGVQLLDGSDIPSQYVSANKKYLTSRQLDSLEQVHAFAGTMHAVAMRADGVVANHPADGRLDAGELARFETGELAESLFPEEKAALPKLWKLLEAPSGNAVSMANIAPELEPTEHRVEPSGVVAPASVAISSLATEWQTLAKRVELLANGDGNASTIQVADVDHALANPGPFTPAEIEQLKLIKLDILARGTSAVVAEVIVPRPGHTTTHGMIGSLAIDFVTDVSIREERSLSGWERSHSSRSFSGNLYFDWTANATLHTREADSLVLMQLDTGKETVVSGSEIELPELAGSVVVERYVAGARQETSLVAFPAFSPGSHMGDYNWGQYLDYDFVLADHTRLVRSVTSTRYESRFYYNLNDTSQQWFATFRWDLQGSPSPGENNEADVLAHVEAPRLPLPTGRYAQALSNGEIAYVDIYRPGVFFGRVGNKSAQLMRSGDSFAAGFDDGTSISFEGTALWVRVGDDAEQHFTLSVAQRIK
jgi:hypothetical protein